MSCAELLLELRNLGARVWLEDDRLRVAAPQGALTNEIRRELKDHRSELLDWLKRQGSVRPALVARVGREKLPLSYAQQRLWFLYQMEGAGAAYNIPLALRLEGELDVSALEQALGDVVERHEALRTVFPQEEGVPYQKVLEGEETRPRLTVETIREAELSGRLAEAAGMGMELERELPLRVWLFRLAEGRAQPRVVAGAAPHSGRRMVAPSAGARPGRGVRGANQGSDTGVGTIAGAVRGLHVVAAGAAGEREGCGERDQPADSFLEEGAGGDAGRADAANGPNTSSDDELSRGNGGVGGGCGVASRVAGAGAAKRSEFVHGAAGGSGGIAVADGSGRGHTDRDGGGGAE